MLIPALAAVLQENPRLAAMMRLPFMAWADFQQLNNKYLDRMNSRRSHHLQGFEEAGLTRAFYRLYKGAPWLPLDAHYDAAHDEMKAAIEAACANPENCRVLRMTPAEAFEQGRKKLIPYPAWGMPELLPDSCETGATVKWDHTFKFDRKELGSDLVQYYSLLTGCDGSETLLHKSARKYVCHLNPLNPGELFVSDPDGRFLGVAKQIQRHCRSDYDNIRHNLGEVKHIEAQLAKELKPYGKQLLEKQVQDAEANVAAMQAVTPKKPEKAQREPRAEDFDQGPHTDTSPIDYLNKKAAALAASR